jgi:hypothetical protein
MFSMRDHGSRAVGVDEAETRVPGGGVIRREFYRPTLRENLVTLGEAIALRFSTRMTLVVGPYVGEFGHEIMDFQSFVHWLRRRYREVHVITFPGREPLYRGCVLHQHNFELRTAGYIYGRISHDETRQYAREFARKQGLVGYDLFSPAHLRTRWHRRVILRQHHEVIRPLRSTPPNEKVVFHFRHIDKQGPDRSRNFRPELAQELCRLCRIEGYEISCIGHPQYALCPSGCEDCRTADLEQTVSEIAACRLVVGELSGPMHLAAYCAKPIMIWAPDSWRIAGAAKRNPFNVPMFVVRDDTTNPAPEEIVGKLRGALDVLRQRGRTAVNRKPVTC